MPGTVTVGCRIPNGLLLRLGPDLVHVNGSRFEGMGTLDESTGRMKEGPWKIVHGFGLTPGIDADRFREWLEQNRDLEAVRQGLIWGVESDPEGECIRRARGARSGLEPSPQPNPPPGRRTSSFSS